MHVWNVHYGSPSERNLIKTKQSPITINLFYVPIKVSINVCVMVKIFFRKKYILTAIWQVYLQIHFDNFVKMGLN